MSSPYPGYEIWLNNNPSIPNNSFLYESPGSWTSLSLNKDDGSHGFYFSFTTGGKPYQFGNIATFNGVVMLAQSTDYPPINFKQYKSYWDNAFALPDTAFVRRFFKPTIVFHTWVESRHTKVVFLRGLETAKMMLGMDNNGFTSEQTPTLNAPRQLLLEGVLELDKRINNQP